MANERILFIAPRFFNIEKQIESELRLRGAKVDFLPDRPFKGPLNTAIARIFPKLISLFSSIYYRKFTNISKDYSHILVVNGQTLSIKYLKWLKKENPNAITILYLWDSIKNRKNLLEKLSHFDRVLSFNKGDADQYNLVFRPLFFSSSNKTSGMVSVKRDYDLTFIGTAHSDRYDILSKIKVNMKVGKKYFFYMYLQAPWVYQLRKLIDKSWKNSDISEFSFQPIKEEEINSIYSKSFIIIDIEHPNQDGLTNRLLNVLKLEKKIVTTNKSVVEYDFYEKNNIYIIDRKNPVISDSFFASCYKPIPSNILRKYSLSYWVDEVLGIQ